MANRYFVDPLPAPGTSTLQGDLAHHLATVLRVRPGQQLLLGDGRGQQCTATVERIAGGAVEVLLAPAVAVAPLPLRLLLAFAPPRWTRAEWLFEHGTELGVAGFQPLLTARTRPGQPRLARWQQIVRAAAGQCDRAHLPVVLPPCALQPFLDRPDLPARPLLASPGARPPQPQPAGEVVLLVGPEGGFDQGELTAIATRGFVPAGLGPHVLRTETAALAGAALLLAPFTTAAAAAPPRS
jgi:16S rRNA (uracil1498-N3)-methyltransferase